ncbi:hypothetical protein MKW98_029096, partial [Papaver atlanticum]
MASTSCSLILVTLIFAILIREELVNGETISDAMNKAIIKTIKVFIYSLIFMVQVDEDEIIDCSDIYKQPSLNHPSLHNHSIQ